MNISVELTMSPLQDGYEPHIIDFIKVLRASKFTVLENPLSTQVYGKYDEVMPFLTKAIGDSMAAQDAVLVYMKLVKSDRSDYTPHF
ncbi:MAG: thiamine-binding protein [Nonlabens sp.]|nr:thiamine-binding protein [Nonlabens sp.]